MSEDKKKRYGKLALELGVILVIFLALGAWKARGTAEGPAPVLAGTSTEGLPLALEAEPGVPTLVHFWGSWCGVCRAEEGTINALAKDHRVLTVAVGSGGHEQVAAYLAERGLAFPTIVDHAGLMAKRWGVSAYPTSFIVGADGSIRDVEVGYTSSFGLRARLFFAR